MVTTMAAINMVAASKDAEVVAFGSIRRRRRSQKNLDRPGPRRILNLR